MTEVVRKMQGRPFVLVFLLDTFLRRAACFDRNPGFQCKRQAYWNFRHHNSGRSFITISVSLFTTWAKPQWRVKSTRCLGITSRYIPGHMMASMPLRMWMCYVRRSRNTLKDFLKKWHETR